MSTVLWERKVKGCTLTTVQGDITLEHIDAIVNAANEHLHHGGGVAAAIVRAGGASIQLDSADWVAEHGRVATGTAAITGGGKLSAKFVIHAVGPVWGTGNEVAKLTSAITSALELAEQHNLASISFPAISTGIFGFPKELCAKTFFDTVENWLDEHPQRSLQTIRFCNFDNPTANVFEREARRRFG
ncbi:MAG: macro domain-containing protein [Planctomycetes bacterium]|nr:macro domain-containing protein [Planctomycetota bacterium]